jgi:hypothetical protein
MVNVEQPLKFIRDAAESKKLMFLAGEGPAVR